MSADFLRKNYFLIAALVGLVCAYLVAYSLMGSFVNAFLVIDNAKNLATPVYIGLAEILLVAYTLDRKNLKRSFFKTGLALPGLLYMTGVSIGCFTSFLVLGNLEDFSSWFVTPFLLLTMIGLPLALVIGAIFFVSTRKLLE